MYICPFKICVKIPLNTFGKRRRKSSKGIGENKRQDILITIGYLVFYFSLIVCMDNIEHFHYFSFSLFIVYKVIAVLAIIIMAFFIFIYPFYCWFNSWLTAFASTKACKIIFTMFIIFLHSFYSSFSSFTTACPFTNTSKIAFTISFIMFVASFCLSRLFTSLLYREASFRTIAFHYVNITVL